jgi:hypothetical protein
VVVAVVGLKMEPEVVVQVAQAAAVREVPIQLLQLAEL